MALSEQTKLEMRAGAQALATHQGKSTLTDEEWERLSFTAERDKKLREWEQQGVIKIELLYANTMNTHKLMTERNWVRIIHVGYRQFKEIDPNVGGWPSELLFAKVALAIHAGEHLKKKG